MKFLRHMRTVLRYPSMTRLSSDARIMDRAYTLVKYYYIILPSAAFTFFESWTVPLVQKGFSPLWPLAWAQLLSLTPDSVAIVLRLAFLVATLLGLAFYRHRAARIIVFLALWQAHAFMSSFGQPNHQWYPWLYTSFIFIFLPDISSESDMQEKKRDYLLGVWWAQASFMLIYTMAGFWKFEMACTQFLQGQMHGFSEYAFASQIANWLPKLQNEALLGPFFIMHPAIGWPLYVTSHFFQLFALWVMFRPSLQKLWAYELIIFHIMTYLTMGIDFSPFILLLLIFFFHSPFEPEKNSLGRILRDLPIVGYIIERTSLRMQWRR